MNEKIELAAKCAVMETKYGDRFVICDSYVNAHGRIVSLWHTEGNKTITYAPEWLEKAGYKVIRKFTKRKIYAQGHNGLYFEVYEGEGGVL